MSEAQFRAFLLGALFGGFVQGLRNDRKVALSQLRPDRLLELDQLVPGETISAATAAFFSQLDFIPRPLRKSGLSFSESQQCWSSLVEHRRLVEARLEELQGILTRYRDYRAFSLLDQEKVGRTLEAVREFVQAVRTSYSPVEGLEHFRSRFSDARLLNTSLNAFNHIHGFFSQDFTGFSFMTHYAEQAAPLTADSIDFSAVREELSALWERLAGWNPAAAPEQFQQLRDQFDSWQQSYARAYHAAHQQFHGSSEYEQYEELLKGKTLNLLGRLERLDAFLPEKSAAAIREELSRRQSARCLRSVFEELQQRPACSCNFRPGQKQDRLLAESLQKEIELQLQQLVSQIGHPRFREHLDRFIFQLGRGGPQGPASPDLAVAGRLKDVASVADLLQIEKDLSAAFLERLNNFEPGKRAFAVKSFRSFRQRLGTMPQPKKRLVEEFAEWLAEDLADPDEPIVLVEQVTESRSSARDEIRSRLAETAPRLLQEFQRLSEEEFLFRLFAADLVTRFQLPLDKARACLGLLPSDPAVLEQYARLGDTLEAIEASWLEQARDDFEERVGRPGYEELGLLPDSSEGLAALLAQEVRFPSLAGEAAARLLRKLIHADGGQACTARQILKEQWIEPPRPLDRKEKQDYRDLIESACWLRVASEALKAADLQDGLETCEEIFGATACLVPFMLDRLRVYLRQADLADRVDLSRLQGELESKLEAFLETYQRRLHQLDQDGLRRVHQVLARETPRLLSRLQAESAVFLFVDALACSLWKLAAEELEEKMPPRLRLLSQKTAYAHLPSNTREQVEHWLQVEALRLAPAQKLQKGFSGGRPKGGVPATAFHKMDWIDEKVHTSRESPYFLHREIVDQFVPQFVSLAERLPPRTLLVLFSDHGFTENPAFQPQDKYAQPRYRHGGSSPFEVVVPVAFFFAA